MPKTSQIYKMKMLNNVLSRFREKLKEFVEKCIHNTILLITNKFYKQCLRFTSSNCSLKKMKEKKYALLQPSTAITK